MSYSYRNGCASSDEAAKTMQRLAIILKNLFCFLKR